jgi:hypothetical protein
MNTWGKIAVGVGAAAGVGYLLKISRTKAQLETVAKAMLHKLDATGLTVHVDVQIKNPTKGSLSIKYPFVKIVSGDKLIGSSRVINQDIKIPSFGEVQIRDIMINIPLLSLFSLGLNFYKSVLSGQALKAKVITVSTIDLGWKTLPYEKTDEVVLKKGADGGGETSSKGRR